jgi:hypothetical protein
MAIFCGTNNLSTVIGYLALRICFLTHLVCEDILTNNNDCRIRDEQTEFVGYLLVITHFFENFLATFCSTHSVGNDSQQAHPPAWQPLKIKITLEFRCRILGRNWEKSL